MITKPPPVRLHIKPGVSERLNVGGAWDRKKERKKEREREERENKKDEKKHPIC